MKKHVVNTLAALAVASTIAQPALAEVSLPGAAARTVVDTPADGDLLASAFEGAAFVDAHTLDEAAMRDTRGELWPFIVSVVGVDLALSSYFWGVYVPTVGGGSGCVTCSYSVVAAQK